MGGGGELWLTVSVASLCIVSWFITDCVTHSVKTKKIKKKKKCETV